LRCRIGCAARHNKESGFLDILRLILAVTAAYLIGSIPVGYIVVFVLTGKDVRMQGSGRTGGTNALRAGGSRAGFLTGAGDMLKGLAAVLVARAIAGHTPTVDVLAGFAAVVGHNWSIYMRFKGGAGTGTAIGAAVAMWPLSGLWLVPGLPILLNVIGYASVTSLLFAAIIPLGFVIYAAVGLGPWLYVVYGVLAGLAIAWALRPNIKRLLNGTEPRAPQLKLQDETPTRRR
jgi:glycerol-3-phosphate acyltransferase PlsY